MRSRLRGKKNQGWECSLLDVLISTVTGATVIVYEISDGPFTDPATTVERRGAIFASQDGTLVKDEETLREEISKSYDDYYYEGLPDASIDEVIALTKEGDREAERFRSEQENLQVKDDTHYYGARDHNKKAEMYEAFLDAIDTLAEDGEDEQAWEAIDTWRQQYVLQYER